MAPRRLVFQTEEDATRAMFASDAGWPNILLPVKNRLMPRRDGFPVMGYLREPANKDGLTIIIGNIFGPTEGADAGTTYHYRDVAAAMDAGWVVD